MGQNTKLTQLLVAGLAVGALAGCDLSTDGGSAPPPAATWEAATDLESASGGYTSTDEPVAFGDPEVASIATLEVSQPAFADADSMPGDSTFAVRILWGQLQGKRDAVTPMDWTGQVSIDRGRLGLLHTIAFEFPGDHLVMPRPDARTLGFVSHTLPHFDGLLLVVREAPGDTPTELRLETASFEGSWSLADLAGRGIVVPVGDEGNAVSIDVAPLVRPACPNGFARGGWLVREGERGVFRGLLVTPGGLPAGHIRGHFGVNEAGERVWFAKLIGPYGRLLGLARGTWTPSEDPTVPGGRFAGRIESRLGPGEIAGRYLPGREGENAALGFFEARWHLACESQPPTRP
jgi:hypothetical protein